MQYNTGIAMQIISTKKVVQYSNTGKFAKMVHQYFFLVKMWVGVSSLILRKLMIAGSL